MDDAHADSYHHGDMNIAAQTADYGAFVAFSKWGSLFIATLILFLTLWFCTGAGFLTALVSAAILLALGGTLLRGGPAPAH